MVTDFARLDPFPDENVPVIGPGGTNPARRPMKTIAASALVLCATACMASPVVAQTLAGALAIDERQGDQYGWAVDYETAGAARSAALGECGAGCSVVLTFERCAAYAADQAADSAAVGWAESYSSADGARQAALSECGSRGGYGCMVRVWGCNGPVVEEGLGLDRAVRRQIQEGLQAVGFDPGGADGMFGPRTRAAIRRWQTSRGERATGYLDGALVAALRPSPVGQPMFRQREPPGADTAAASASVAPPAVPGSAQQQPPAATLPVEVVFWQSIATSTNAAEFEAYLRRFPNGMFSELAQIRLEALRAAATEAPAAAGRPSGGMGSPASSPRVSGAGGAAFGGAAAGADAPRRAGDVFRDCAECPEMVVLPGGGLALGRYEVTVGEYRAFASATGAGAGDGCTASFTLSGTAGADSWRWPGFPQTDRHPVTCVSWDDAQAYVSWLRLPVTGYLDHAGAAFLRAAGAPPEASPPPSSSTEPVDLRAAGARAEASPSPPSVPEPVHEDLPAVDAPSGDCAKLAPTSLREGALRTWTAYLTVKGPCLVTLHVALPDSSELIESLERVGGEKAYVLQRKRGHWEVHVKGYGETRLRLTMEGLADRFRNDVAVKYAWYESGRQTVRRLFNGPVAQPRTTSAGMTSSSSVVRAAFGTGLSRRHDDVIDFRVDEKGGRLWIENDSRLRLSGTLGALFTAKRLSGTATLDVLTSLEFTNRTNRALDALLLGMAVSWGRFSVGAGVSFRMGEELGAGFRRDAALLVDDLKDHEEHGAQWTRFEGLPHSDKLFDGFPLIDPRKPDEPFFPPDQVIRKSTNTDLFFGVFIPVDVGKIVAGLVRGTE